MQVAEIWKDIEGFIGYQISNKGRVKSCIKYREGIILKVKIDNHKGRPKAMVTLTDIKNDKKITKSIATLVYKHFIDKNINTLTNIIEYKDKDYRNCSVDNLYAISRADFFNQKEHLANMNNSFMDIFYPFVSIRSRTNVINPKFHYFPTFL